MPDFKEILGEAYTPELEKVLSEKFISKENAQGESKRLKSELDAAKSDIAKHKREAEELRQASLTSEEKAKLELENLRAQADARLKELSTEQAKLKLSAALAKTGMPLDSHMETLNMIAGYDPERAETIATGMQSMIADILAVGEARANSQHLKNNGAPHGGANNKTELQEAEAKLKAAQDSGDQLEIMQQLMRVHTLSSKE